MYTVNFPQPLRRSVNRETAIPHLISMRQNLDWHVNVIPSQIGDVRLNDLVLKSMELSMLIDQKRERIAKLNLSILNDQCQSKATEKHLNPSATPIPQPRNLDFARSSKTWEPSDKSKVICQQPSNSAYQMVVYPSSSGVTMRDQIDSCPQPE